MFEDMDGVPATAKEPFDADKMIYAIKKTQEELNELGEEYRRNASAVEVWWKQKKESREAKIDFLKNLVADYMRAEKKKTHDGPWGKVSIRKAGGGLIVTDETEVTNWVTESGREDLIRVKKSVDKNALKSYLKETGELPPGTDLEPERESVTVKV